MTHYINLLQYILVENCVPRNSKAEDVHLYRVGQKEAKGTLKLRSFRLATSFERSGSCRQINYAPDVPTICVRPLLAVR